MDLFADLDAAPEAPPVEIRVSARRRKSVEAHWEGDTIVVVVPQRLPKRDRQVYADELAAKLIAGRERTRPSDAALGGTGGSVVEDVSGRQGAAIVGRVVDAAALAVGELHGCGSHHPSQ